MKVKLMKFEDGLNPQSKLKAKNVHDFLNEDLNNIAERNKKKEKQSILRSLLNRSNLMLNKYDKIIKDGNILKIKTSYFDYGKGTEILPILKHKSFYFDYWIDIKNKKLINKNFLGGVHDLSDIEIESILNKYYWYYEK